MNLFNEESNGKSTALPWLQRMRKPQMSPSGTTRARQDHETKNLGAHNLENDHDHIVECTDIQTNDCSSTKTNSKRDEKQGKHHATTPHTTTNQNRNPQPPCLARRSKLRPESAGLLATTNATRTVPIKRERGKGTTKYTQQKFKHQNN